MTVLVSVQLPGVDDTQHAADLAELGRLAKTLGLDVIGSLTQRRNALRGATVLGEGKLVELARWTGGDGLAEAVIPRQARIDARKRKRGEIEDEEEDLVETVDDSGEDDVDEDDETTDGGPPPGKLAKVVVVDHDLSPTMQRNLERATGAQVLDRTQVIVEIFHRHAKSRQARLQVEIARLTYVAPRLRETGGGGDRQRGGIGGRGAGESALELDRRKIRDRISELRREIEKIEREQGTRRVARSGQRRVALVGYTNAGKSSLMRALTSSGVYVADKLFATLDTTVRALRPETVPRILVSDTVGFIKKLPHQLVASFRSTLDEALEASVLLFLVDASDPTFREQLAVTNEVLGDIGADAVPSMLILNKRDRLSEAEREALRQEFPAAHQISAHDADDVARIREVIIEFFDGALEHREVFVAYRHQALVQLVYERAAVKAERHDEEGTHFEVRASRAALDDLEQAIAKAVAVAG